MDQLTVLQQIEEAVRAIRSRCALNPRVGIVLGSGLGNLVREIVVEQEIDYETIPHFPVSTVEGHCGKLIFGQLSGQAVVVLSGRLHFYEGYTPQQVVFPIRVLKFLGVETLMVSNAAGRDECDFSGGGSDDHPRSYQFVRSQSFVGRLMRERLGRGFRI